ncbi:C48 family peptidase [Skeletonema marinoi]|uniref:C48 family peptidase n=1 Tax=Skeletonema marinoi TaxID=267567 RepID=A0AAD9D4T8_9STRA|nr:C48 family peptidase [Skeletonema marinoi]
MTSSVCLFFSKLLSTGPHGNNAPCYKFKEVKRWGSQLRRRHGILGLKELYVPINHQQGHWLFLRVQMDTKVITLWDSQGRKEENQLYLQSMLRYLGDVYKSKTGQDEATWKREWELIDDSVNSPRQHSGYDCGVFVITNITLLAQKIPLKRKSQRKTLESGLRFSCGLPVKTAFSTKTNQQRQRRQATAAGAATKSTAKRERKSIAPTSTTSSATKERQKRRRRNNNQRIILGGSRPKGIVHSSDMAPSAQLESMVNRKRSAISVAEGDASRQSMTQRHAPLKKKKGKIQS